MGRAVTYTEHAHRKTVTALDVVHSLKHDGITLYGFGGWGEEMSRLRAFHKAIVANPTTDQRAKLTTIYKETMNKLDERLRRAEMLVLTGWTSE